MPQDLRDCWPKYNYSFGLSIFFTYVIILAAADAGGFNNSVAEQQVGGTIFFYNSNKKVFEKNVVFITIKSASISLVPLTCFLSTLKKEKKTYVKLQGGNWFMTGSYNSKSWFHLRHGLISIITDLISC